MKNPDDVIMGLQPERGLDAGIVGGRAGLPHGAVAQVVRRQDEILHGGAGGDDLLDLGYFGMVEPHRAAGHYQGR